MTIPYIAVVRVDLLEWGKHCQLWLSSLSLLPSDDQVERAHVICPICVLPVFIDSHTHGLEIHLGK